MSWDIFWLAGGSLLGQATGLEPASSQTSAHSRVSQSLHPVRSLTTVWPPIRTMSKFADDTAVRGLITQQLLQPHCWVDPDPSLHSTAVWYGHGPQTPAERGEDCNRDHLDSSALYVKHLLAQSPHESFMFIPCTFYVVYLIKVNILCLFFHASFFK